MTRIIFNDPKLVRVGLRYDVFRGQPRYGADLHVGGYCIAEYDGEKIRFIVVRPHAGTSVELLKTVYGREAPVFEWRWDKLFAAEWGADEAYAEEMYRWGLIPANSKKTDVIARLNALNDHTQLRGEKLETLKGMNGLGDRAYEQVRRSPEEWDDD